MKIIITGSSGFIGQRFVQYNSSKYELIPISLRSNEAALLNLQNADAVLHLAGKAHEMKSIADQIYFDINFELTKKIADKAKEQGVTLFIYISSVKVYGDSVNTIVDENSECRPNDAYGKSKLAAEIYLRSIQNDQFKVAIIRPPLVYGAGVKGNMVRLLELAEKNYPLPFGGISNERSMVFIDNLVELINRIIDTRAQGIFIAGDRQPLSTSELIGLIRSFMNKKEGLITIPEIGRKIFSLVSPDLFNRLFGSFVIDNRHTNETLGFIPPYSTDYGVKTMVDWYLGLKNEGNLQPGIK